MHWERTASKEGAALALAPGSGDKFDSSIEISFQYGIGILLFRRPVLNMVLRFGILTYVLTAAAPAAAPDEY